MTRPVLLVGSVPMQSAETVFREVSERIGPLLKRVPDGETGEPSAWTAWQGKCRPCPARRRFGANN